VLVYGTALKCAQADKLRQEWERYHAQTQSHVQTLQDVCAAVGLDAEEETPGRAIVRDLGQALVAAMDKALAGGEPAAAQIVACECVVFAETKDHLDWQLIGEVAKNSKGESGAKAMLVRRPWALRAPNSRGRRISLPSTSQGRPCRQRPLLPGHGLSSRPAPCARAGRRWSLRRPPTRRASRCRRGRRPRQTRQGHSSPAGRERARAARKRDRHGRDRARS
jgi:hypothetical protein